MGGLLLICLITACSTIIKILIRGLSNFHCPNSHSATNKESYFKSELHTSYMSQSQNKTSLDR